MTPLNTPLTTATRFDHKRVSSQIRNLAMPVLWTSFAPDPNTGLQNFTADLVDEFQNVIEGLRSEACIGKPPLRYAVVQSRHPEYFSVGGDLHFFRECIQARQAERLYTYSMRCLNLLHGWSAQMKETLTSISLVQGRALGGGFEMALSTDFLIAEEQSTFGFPEIMFGLFPCTGAMSLLSDRIGARQAERMMTNKKIYRAAELLDMGLIDQVCGKGEGEMAVEQFVANHSSRLKARLKVQASRYRHSPLNHDEGVRIVEDWVETAMSLTPEELRSLDMLIMMQRPGREEDARLAS
ncbi:MAG: enoyl-CoA hydratase [Lysobacteraceae bacterium]|nr:MAG: enoyl-CoA hydratase [Xanthomonadaceae bacterium]